MHNSINQEELSALTAVSQAASLHQKPRLPKKYYISLSLTLLAAVLLFALPAVINPTLYVETTISPNYPISDSLALFIRIRGAFVLILIAGIVLLHRKKLNGSEYY